MKKCSSVAMVVWLHRDALIKRLDFAIDAAADDKAAFDARSPTAARG